MYGEICVVVKLITREVKTRFLHLILMFQMVNLFLYRKNELPVLRYTLQLLPDSLICHYYYYSVLKT